MSDKPYITHWLTAKMAATGKNVTDRVKVGMRIVQKRKGVFNSDRIDVEEDIFEDRTTWVPDGKYSDLNIDKADLAQRIQETCNTCWKDGYELFQTIDCIEGRYDWKTKTGNAGLNEGMWGWAYGYGYSLTDGVIMVFRKRSLV